MITPFYSENKKAMKHAYEKDAYDESEVGVCLVVRIKTNV
ncbi:hypothetical protein JOC83_001869 [Bacillus iocasae]|uniref:Uncharacterized protein n=1 Tax=Priestia iocasae TaxID=2291674 RepID=A0ABS2QUC0_9BACI|nr:hypothetical protein [Metabacillus iocasae]